MNNIEHKPHPSKKRVFTHQSVLASSVEVVFDWHRCEDALNALMPPDKTVQILSRNGGIDTKDSELVFRIYPLGKIFGKRLPLYITWRARHSDYIPYHQFVDTQIQGPFAYWRHQHRFEPAHETACRMTDYVEYALPFAPWSHWVAGWWIHRELQALFHYRHQVLAHRFGHFTEHTVEQEVLP